MTIRYEPRAGCPAAGHDTVWAYDRHGCRCPDALAAKDQRRGPGRRSRSKRRSGRPAAVVDPVRVAAAVRGEPVRLSLAERAAALDALVDLPAARVAAVLRIGRSTVFDHRTRLSSSP